MANATRMPAPIPMDDRLLDLALEMKTVGLPWEPEVGCFVWDHEGFISQPSPFPKRIYFILSMKRFLTLFGDVEQMKRRLVWLPTWYQARQICGRIQLVAAETDLDGSASRSSTAEEEMIRLYQCILQRLKPPADSHKAIEKRVETEWIRSVMVSDLGDVTRLPKPVQDRIEAVYEEVASAYLGWRRIQERQAKDWLPQETTFDAELLCDLGHFYSDYQKPIQSLDRIRKAVHLLGAIDPREDHENFDRLISLILESDNPQLSQQSILNRLTKGE